MRKKYGILTMLFILVVLLLTGCGNEGRLDEGDCPVEVRLSGLPEGYAELTQNAKDQIQVTLRLENVINEKWYTFRLTDENHYAAQATLNPGTYRVLSCYMTGNGGVGMAVEANVEELEVSRDTISIISVDVTNKEDFNEWVEQMKVDSGILRAGQFSRKVQFEGQIIDMEQITDYVEFTHEQLVPAYGKVELSNPTKGVYVTLLNDTGDPQSWQNCRVIGIRFTRDNVIFGRGARVRMLANEVFHAEDGIYGTPDDLEGCVLIGADYDNFSAIYRDTISGDRMTLNINAAGERILEITYEFELFE